MFVKAIQQSAWLVTMSENWSYHLRTNIEKIGFIVFIIITALRRKCEEKP